VDFPIFDGQGKHVEGKGGGGSLQEIKAGKKGRGPFVLNQDYRDGRERIMGRTFT